jgi:small-conductance mechanosensitive channel
MTDLHELLAQRYLGNSLAQWGWAALAFTVPFIVLPLARDQLLRLRKLWVVRRSPEQQTSGPMSFLIGLLGSTSPLVRLVVAFYLAEKILKLPAALDHFFDVVIVLGVWLQVGLWLITAVRHLLSQREAMRDPAVGGSLNVLMFCVQVVVWAVVALLALDNLGVNISALLAGLGIGGIAVALAVQTMLGDLLGSLSITLDKPFVVGDWVKLEDYEGVVEHIGLKSTRLRSVSGEQIIVTNADMLKSRLRNLGRMPERRVQFKLHVAYDTPPDKIIQVAPLIEELVRAQPQTNYVGCLLLRLGTYALEYEVTYFVVDPQPMQYGQTVDAINRAIVARFAEAGISFAYPTQRNIS